MWDAAFWLMGVLCGGLGAAAVLGLAIATRNHRIEELENELGARPGNWYGPRPFTGLPLQRRRRLRLL